MIFKDYLTLKEMFTPNNVKKIADSLLYHTLLFITAEKMKAKGELLLDSTQKSIYHITQKDGNSEAVVFINYMARLFDYMVSLGSNVDGIRLFYDYKAEQFKIELGKDSDVKGLSYTADIGCDLDIKRNVVFKKRLNKNKYRETMNRFKDEKDLLIVKVEDEILGGLVNFLQYMEDNKELMQLMLVVDKYKNRFGLYTDLVGIKNQGLSDAEKLNQKLDNQYKMLYVINNDGSERFKYSYIDESLIYAQYAVDNITTMPSAVYHSYIESIMLDNEISSIEKSVLLKKSLKVYKPFRKGV